MQLPARGRRRHDAAARATSSPTGSRATATSRCVPDLATLRRIPWLETTALVLCDLVDEETGEPVEVSPRQILQRQVERAAAARLHGEVRVRARVLPVPRVATRRRRRRATRTSRRTRRCIEDYHILQTTRDEYLIRQIRNGDGRRGRPGRVLEGRGRARPARDQPALRRRARDGRPPRRSTRTAPRRSRALNGRSITFMAKYSMDEVGSSCHVHSSLWDADGDRVADVGATTRPTTMSPAFRGWLGGQLADRPRARVDVRPDRQLVQAVPARVVGADRARRGATTTARAASGVVGHGQGFRLESRIPGADVNPYLAFAATIAAGLHGIEHGIEPPPTASTATRTTRRRAPARPVEPRRRDRRSSRAARSPRDAFGADVHDHLVNTARQEWAALQPARSPTGSAAATSSSSEPCRRKPLIAVPAYPVRPGRIEGWIDAGVAVPEPYLAALERAGRAGSDPHAEPIVDAERADDLLDHFDGLLLLGGGDLDPATYGAEADRPHLRRQRRSATPSSSRWRRAAIDARHAAARDLPRRAGAQRRCSAARSTSTSPAAPAARTTARPASKAARAARPRPRRPARAVANAMGATRRPSARRTTIRPSTGSAPGCR